MPCTYSHLRATIGSTLVARWAGRKELRVALPRPGRLAGVLGRVPALAALLRRRKRVLVAVNRRMAGLGATVRDGDEVALMTAFSGG